MPRGGHKYKAKPQRTADGYFASKKELARWEQLKLLQQAGAITNLSRRREHCTFPLRGYNGSEVCKYIADYVFVENGKNVAADAKGMVLDVYKLKRKLFLDNYPNWEHREY